MENTVDLRKKEYLALKTQAFERKKEVAEKTMSVRLGKSANFNKKEIKREIARINTILREKEILNAK